MKLLPLIALAAFLATLDASIRYWRSSAPVSTAPIFSLPMVEEALAKPGPFQRTLDIYSADRGAKLELDGPQGTAITVFYIEWEEVEVAPLMDIVGHTPELCNVPAGFDFLSLEPERIYSSGGRSPMNFDSTIFEDPSGRIIYVYKAAWIKGVGSWSIRKDESRSARLTSAFKRGRGPARVLQAGITGAVDESHAWQIFQSQVLSQLAWSD